jgi:hypothetical protein
VKEQPCNTELHLDVIVDGDNSLVFVEGKLVALYGELDGVLRLEDLIEFLELWRVSTKLIQVAKEMLTVRLRVSGKKKKAIRNQREH